MNSLWTLELIACSYMTGLILLVHLIHYPSFAWIRQSEFRAYSRFHSRAITPIVLPAMALELLVAIALVYFAPSLITNLNLFSVVALWFITGFKSAPSHRNLAKEGYTLRLVQDLMKWNSIRTIIWCTRLIALSIFAIHGFHE
jgi:hypothetical protein